MTDRSIMDDHTTSLPTASLAMHRQAKGEAAASTMDHETARKGRTRSCSLSTRWLVASVFLVHSLQTSSALSESRIQGQVSMRLSSHPALRSRSLLFRRQQQQRSSSTARHMVLTTPENIIEQASTQNLLDDLIDESVRTSARRTIMMQFDPSSGWIWRRWKGTVFSETWHSAVAKMAYATLVFFIFRSYPEVKEQLRGFSILWGQLLSVTTFTLTFFLNQSYALWRKCYQLSRRLQGRLNDLGMTLAAHAARKTPASPTEPSTYTAASRQLLELVSRYIRMFNLLTYASFTRSHRPILTPRGMRRLVERGLLTAQEREVLVDAEIPATQRHNALILWIIRAFIEGRQAGHIVGGAGFENQFMEKIHVIRAQYGGIGDELQGRMPLAYAHIVQVLVDVILWMYPIMAFSSEMSPFLGVLGTGLLTMFYQGLFDLAKQFLDPYDNENYGKGDDPLCVDTLIAETNSGSVRWMNGFDGQPFSSQRLRDGELFEYLLPVRGYSIEELAQMEEERLQKEREQQEKREREEAERIKREEEEAEEEEEEEEEEELEFFAAFPSNETLVNATAAFVELTTTPFQEDAELDQEGIPTEEVHETVDKGDLKVHKVYTLEDGTPVTLKEKKTVEERETVNVAENVTQIISVNGDSPEGGTAINATENVTQVITVNGDSPESGTAVSAVEEDDDKYIHSLIDFEMFKDLDWHDELTEDGKEYRLSDQLADEVYEEELEAAREKNTPLTFEDYTSRAAEIMEAAENELIETAEILGAAPGAQTSITSQDKLVREGAPRVPEPKRSDRKEQSGPFKYDQTRLDGISQLWGLPPEDPSALEGYPEPGTLDYDESRFDGISQLWGETPTPASASKDSTIIDGGGDFAGITQLWDEDSLASTTRKTPSKKSTNGGDGNDDDSTSVPYDTSIFAGLEWFDEVGPDGNECRLSQMLADEKWEMEPKTAYADFRKEEEEFLREVEDEKLETEAILKAPPGADSPDPSETKTTKPIKEEIPVNATGTDDSLEALEMDNDITGTNVTLARHAMDDAWTDGESVEAASVEGANGDLTFYEDNVDLEEQGDRGDVDHVSDQ